MSMNTVPERLAALRAAMKVAVRGMLPKNTIGKESLKRLHIYADANYEQQAQKPVALDAE